MKVTAAVALAKGEPLVIRELALDTPRSTEVQVRMGSLRASVTPMPSCAIRCIPPLCPPLEPLRR